MDSDLTALDGWIAGIIEGEGCFDTRFYNDRYYSLRLRVKMIDEDIIARVADYFDVSYWSRRPQQEGWQMQYEMEVSGRKLEGVCERLWPLFSERRQAKLIEVMAIVNRNV
jgi:hypothetical protein